MRAMRFQPLSLSRPSLTAPYPISSRTLSFPFLPCLSVPSLAPFPPPPCSLPSPLSSPCLTAYKTTLECKEGWRFPDRPTDRSLWTLARSAGRKTMTASHDRRSRFVGVAGARHVRWLVLRGRQNRGVRSFPAQTGARKFGHAYVPPYVLSFLRQKY